MLTVALSLVLSAAPSSAKWAVYFEPVPTVLGAFMGGVVVSAGTQHVFDDSNWVLMIDATGGHRMRPGVADISSSIFLSVNAGPTRRLFGTGFNGLFVTPGLFIAVAHTNSYTRAIGTRERSDDLWLSFQGGLGLKLSGQWVFGRFLLGTSFGAAVGWLVEGDVDARPWVTINQLSVNDRPRGSGPALSVDLQLRLGFVW